MVRRPLTSSLPTLWQPTLWERLFHLPLPNVIALRINHNRPLHLYQSYLPRLPIICPRATHHKRQRPYKLTLQPRLLAGRGGMSQTKMASRGPQARTSQPPHPPQRTIIAERYPHTTHLPLAQLLPSSDRPPWAMTQRPAPTLQVHQNGKVVSLEQQQQPSKCLPPVHPSPERPLSCFARRIEPIAEIPTTPAAAAAAAEARIAMGLRHLTMTTAPTKMTRQEKVMANVIIFTGEASPLPLTDGVLAVQPLTTIHASKQATRVRPRRSLEPAAVQPVEALPITTMPHTTGERRQRNIAPSLPPPSPTAQKYQRPMMSMDGPPTIRTLPSPSAVRIVSTRTRLPRPHSSSHKLVVAPLT